MTVRALLDAVGDLALPRRCGGCARAGVSWCEHCAGDLHGRLRLPAREIRPRPCPPDFPRTWANSTYDGVLAAAIKAHKDDGRSDLTSPLADLLRGALAACLTDSQVFADVTSGRTITLVAVPSARRAVRERGREPLRELLEFAAVDRRGPWRIAAPVCLGRRVHDQSRLHAAARATNLHGSMRLKNRAIREVEDQICVIADDIVTTGATMAEVARVLRGAGARQVLGVAIAATQRHGGNPSGGTIYSSSS